MPERSVQPYFQQDGITIYHGDCRDVLPQLGSCDLVIADPPYSFGLASTFAEAKAGSWADLMNSASWYASWLTECHRITSNRSGAAWIFNSWRSFPILARAAHDARWPIESLLVWDKQWIGPGGARGLRPSYELVALFAHPGFAITDRGLPDIWQSKWSALKPHGHPAEKPEALVGRLMRESGAQSVLDPFCGSGTTLAAARLLGIAGIGIEAEERYCEMTANRLAQGVLFAA